MSTPEKNTTYTATRSENKVDKTESEINIRKKSSEHTNIDIEVKSSKKYQMNPQKEAQDNQSEMTKTVVQDDYLDDMDMWSDFSHKLVLGGNK